LAGACQLAISPTNTDEVYVASLAEPKANTDTFTSVLRHTTDGGRTWTTIQPRLEITDQIPAIKSALPWDVQALSMSGSRLFGLQAIPSTQPLPDSQAGPVPSFQPALLRLVTSADGGRTWTVLDSQFHAADVGVRSYAVDPADPATIYLLVGRPLLAFDVVGGSPTKAPKSLPDTPPQPSADNGDLYKTTDGGAQWHRVQQDIIFGAAI